MTGRIVFLGTARSGLGHLRRLCAIAAQVRAREEQAELVLMTNAEPSGLSPVDLAVFEEIRVCERQDMIFRLLSHPCGLAVLDTLKVPGMEAFQGRAALILRETPEAKIESFRKAGRPWDLVLVPNPAEAWQPDIGPDFARIVAHAGWILRKTGMRGGSPSSGIVLATGGGGTAETRAVLYPLLGRVIAEARRRAGRPFMVRQALGPRAEGQVLPEADEPFDPGPELNEVFRCADLVISTAGYNSVLELASTDTPALLAAIPRSLDDQSARVRAWGPRLGHGLDPDDPARAAAWIADQIDRPRRRAPLDLGPCGAQRAATLLLDLLCKAS